MDWLAHEELEAEWNARYDYIAELRAEHDDSAAIAYEEEAQERYAAALANGASEAEAEAAYWGDA